MKIHRTSRALIVCIAMLRAVFCQAQTDSSFAESPIAQDTTPATTLADLQNKRSGLPEGCPYKFKPVQLIAPAALIGVGFIGLHCDWAQELNKEIRKGLQKNDRANQYAFEDWLQYAPAVATYGLKLGGLKSKHSYIDMTIITATTYAIMAIGVNSTKYLVKERRPDGSSRNSFPSGHTATVFAGAELLRREYWDVSPWIGVAGYAMAGTTAFFRMYHNRHWFNDVIAGAGYGIFSVQAAYWLYPVITKAFCRKRYLKNTYISPYMSEEGKGLSCTIRL